MSDFDGGKLFSKRKTTPMIDIAAANERILMAFFSGFVFAYIVFWIKERFGID